MRTAPECGPGRPLIPCRCAPRSLARTGPPALALVAPGPGTVRPMVDETKPCSPAWRPATLWEACVSAAGLVVDIGAAEAPGEVVLPAREQTAVVLAAAMHHQLVLRGLDDDVERVREVWLLGADGLAGTLTVSAYSALQAAPAVPGVGGEQREQLLADGAAQHPDARVRWERVRVAAVDAVTAAAREAAVPEDQARPVVLADVLDTEARRRQLARLEDQFGIESY